MTEEMLTPNRQGSSLFLRALPDPNLCCTSAFGSIEPFGKCLVKCPVTCPYVSVSETGYIVKFCTNPKWREFVQCG